jgi:hypothetical protein
LSSNSRKDVGQFIQKMIDQGIFKTTEEATKYIAIIGAAKTGKLVPVLARRKRDGKECISLVIINEEKGGRVYPLAVVLGEGDMFDYEPVDGSVHKNEDRDKAKGLQMFAEAFGILPPEAHRFDVDPKSN